jgi:hypothetical protein
MLPLRLFDWLSGIYRQLSPRNAQFCTSRNRHRTRLPRVRVKQINSEGIERLEDRLLLSAVSWDGEAGDGLWTTAQNWSGDFLPGADDDVTIDVTGNATIFVRGAVPQIRSLISHDTLFIEGRADTGAATLSVGGDFTNFGTLHLETTSNDGHDNESRSSNVVIADGATLTNAASGVIDVRAGQGYARHISGSLTNLGTMTTDAGSILNLDGTGQIFTQAGGQIQSDGWFVLNGGEFHFTGGSLSGTVRANSSTISVADTVTGPSTLFAVGADGMLENNLSQQVTVWIEGSVYYGQARLTAVGDATNAGTIRLESTTNDGHDNESRASLLNVADGATLTNAASGTIDVRAGQGYARRITGHVIQQGLITVAPDYSADFIGTLESAGGQYSGPFNVRDSAVRITASPLVPTTIQLVGPNNRLLTDNLAGTTLWVEGSIYYGASVLTLPSSVSNYGALHLETTSNDGHDNESRSSNVVIADGATLTNAASGVIDVRAGQGYARHISGSLTNLGTMTTDAGSILNLDGTGQIFTQAGGQIQSDGWFVLNGGEFHFTGGSLSGTVRANSSTISVADTVTGPSTLFAVGADGMLENNLSQQVTVWIEGSVYYGQARLTAVGDATNAGTIRLESTTNDGHDNESRASLLNVADGATLTNAASGTIDVRAGQGYARRITGHVIQQGLITVAPDYSADFIGTLESAGGQYSGPFNVRDSAVRITASPLVPTTIQLVGPNNRLLTDNLAGTTLWVEGSIYYGASVLTLPSSVTNYGALHLETTSNDGHDNESRASNMVIADGATLTNAASGVIDVRAGQGYARHLNGQVRNVGTLRTDATVTIGGGNADNINQGVIALNGATIAFSGSSFVNDRGALIGGHGGLDTSSVTFTNLGTVDLSPPSVTNVLIDSGLIQIEFDSAAGMNSATVLSVLNYTLKSSGGDGIFGNGNDIDLSARLSGIIFLPQTQTALLRISPPIAEDLFELTFNGPSIIDTNGVPLFASSFGVVREKTSVPAAVFLNLSRQSDSGASDTDKVTNDTTPTIEVTVNKAGTISLDADNDGVFESTLVVADAGTYDMTSLPLPEGMNHVHVKFTPNSGYSAQNDLTLTIDTIGPRATFAAPNGRIGGDVNHATVLFNEPIGVFHSDAVALSGPAGPIAVGNPAFISGTTYSIPFASQNADGIYSLSIGPNVFDLAGNPMDQDLDHTNGEPSDDVFTKSFTHVNSPHINAWTNPNGGDWNDFMNWSTGVVPTVGDDVVIDMPSSVVITHSSGDTVVNSINGSATLEISGGTLTVNGSSHLTGPLSVRNLARLIVDGSQATLTATNTTNLDGGSLSARNGGILSLPNLNSFTAYSEGLLAGSSFEATGAGSVLDLSHLAEFVGTVGWAANFGIVAQQGGRLDLSNLAAITSGSAQIAAIGAGSVVDLSALTAFNSTLGFQTANASLTTSQGGTIITPNLGSLSQVNLSLNADTLIGLTQLTRFTNAYLDVNGVTGDFHKVTDVSGSTIVLHDGGTLDLSQVAHIDSTSFEVRDGVTLSLPSATQFTANNGGIGAYTYFKATGAHSILDLSGLTKIDGTVGWAANFVVDAEQGGTIDLGRVTAITSGSAQFFAIGVNSRLVLSRLATFSPTFGFQTSPARLVAQDHAQVDLATSTTIQSVPIELISNGVIAAGELRVAAGSTLSGQGDIFANLTNQSSVSLSATPQDIVIHGNYVQTTEGTLAVRLDGPPVNGNYSKLRVTGQSTLAGTLNIQRANGYTPDLQTDYQILIAKQVIGQFATVTGGDVSDGSPITVTQGSSAVILSRNFGRTPIAVSQYVNAVAHTSVYFDVRQITDGTNVEFRLYDPNGNLVFASNATPAAPDTGDYGPFVLEQAGNYSVKIFAPLGENPSYLWQLAPAPAKTFPLILNQPQTGTIGVSGESHSWQFNVVSPSDLALDVTSIVGAGQHLTFTLIDPNGHVVFYTQTGDSNPNTADHAALSAFVKGTYQLVVAGDGDDTAAYQFTLTGPNSSRIVSQALKGSTAGTVNSALFHFNQPMDTSAGNFNLATDLLDFENTSGHLVAIESHWADAQTLVITFAPQSSDEPLFMSLSPDIRTADGKLLDQDADGQAGETPDDIYQADLLLDVTGPRVFLTDPADKSSAPLDHITFHFNESIDPTSFTLGDVASFTGPGGVDLRSQLTSFLAGTDFVTVYFIAQNPPGTYVIKIGPQITDIAGNLMDQNRDGLLGKPNDAYTATIDVQTADLVAAAVADPTPAIYGDTVHFSWTIRNDGNDPVAGQWWDYVYLSADTAWDSGDTLVGKVFRDSSISGTVAGHQGTYQGTLEAKLPAVLPGDYHVIVRTDLLHGVAESNYNNNTAVSTETAHFDLPVLASATPVIDTIQSRGALYYRIEVTPNEAGSILLRFNTTNTTAANELYISRGVLPTRQSYDLHSTLGFTSSPYLVLTDVQPGTYYVLALAAPDEQILRPLGTDTIEATLFGPGHFEVIDSNFGQGGTAGNRTITIHGVNFDRTVNATLTNESGASIPAISYYRTDSQTLYETFDLTHVAPGHYSVAFSNSVGQHVVEPNSFEVVTVTEHATTIIPTISAPPAFRRVFHAPFVHFPVTVSWFNSGLNDVPTPLIQFSSNEPFSLNLDDALSGNGVNLISFVGSASSSGVPGILMPGQGGSATYQVVPRLQQEVVGNTIATFSAVPQFTDLSAPFDWESVKDQLYVPYLKSETDANATFQQFVIFEGRTTLDYLKMLELEFKLLPSIPTDLQVANALAVQDAFDRFVATTHTSIQGRLEHSAFDVTFSQLTVTAENSSTGDVFTTFVRSDGSFTFPALEEGTYHLIVSGGAITTDPSATVDVLPGQHSVVDLSIIGAGTIQGVITNADTGAPLAGVAVLLVSADGVGHYATSDSYGTFTIPDLYPGEYRATATLLTYVPETFELSITSGQLVVAHTALNHGSNVNGIVRDSETGQPVSGAIVTVTRQDGAQVAGTTTDAMGQFILSGLSSGDWQLFATADSYVNSSAQTFNLSGPSTLSVDLQLTHGGALTGTITDAAGMPIADATVTVTSLATFATVQTSPNGTYRLEGLPEGNLTVLVAKAGIPTFKTSIDGPAERTSLEHVDFTLGAGHSFSGQVTDRSGLAIAGAVVTLAPNEGQPTIQLTADDGGRFSAGNLNATTYFCTVTAIGYAPLQQLLDLRSQDIDSLLATLDNGATIAGTIASTVPLSDVQNASAYLFDSKHNLVDVHRVSSNGSYSFADVKEGTYSVLVQYVGHAYTPSVVIVVSGQRATVDFADLAGQIKGNVTDSAGNPLDGVLVSLSGIDSSTGQELTAYTRSMSDGEYLFTGAPETELTVTAELEGYAPRTELVGRPADTITAHNLALDPGYVLTIAVKDGGTNQLIVSAELYVHRHDLPHSPVFVVESDETGHWIVPHLDAGHYDLITIADGFATNSQVIDVTEDVNATIFLLNAPTSLHGSVADGVSGLPFEHASITLTRDGIVWGATTADDNGAFSFVQIPDGEYVVTIDFRGEIFFDIVWGSGTSPISIVVTSPSILSSLDSDPAISVVNGAERLSKANVNQPAVADEATGDLPDLSAADAALKAALDRFIRDLNIYQQVLRIPFTPIAELQKPEAPDTECLTDPLVAGAYQLLLERYNGLWLTQLGLKADLVAAKLKVGTWEAFAAEMQGAATIALYSNATITQSKLIKALGDIGKLSLASRNFYRIYLLAQERLVELIGAGAGEAALATALAAVRSALAKFVAERGVVMAEVGVFALLLKTFFFDIRIANAYMDAWEGYTVKIFETKNAFNAEAASFQSQVDAYNKQLKLYNEVKDQDKKDLPKPQNVVRTLQLGEFRDGSLLRPGSLEQLAGKTWHFEVVGQAPPGLSVQPDGTWSYLATTCGESSCEVDLVVDCEGGFLGYFKPEVRPIGFMVFTVTPIDVYVVSCPSPEDVRKALKDCIRYTTVTAQCGSADPNEIVGPWGVGDGNFVAATSNLNYLVGFENDPKEATAPAAVVRINETLDPSLDPSTFRLGTITFGDTTITEAVGHTSYHSRLDLRSTLGIFVDVSAGIDLTTGVAFWELTSIDPETGEVPFSPLIGFLPPNLNGTEGQGYVTYTVQAKAVLPTGTVINAAATIVFDQNEAIDTPTVFNTIDAGAPSSSVLSLPTSSYPGFTVQWAGHDDQGGSGVANFDIYVSADGGAYTPWLLGTTLTQATYNLAQPHHMYSFYSVATDNVGHREATPTSSQATTSVLEPETQQPATLGGVVFNDQNGDAIRESGEPGLAGWTVFLDSDNNLTLDPGERWTTTDSNGIYTFNNLAAGTYVVAQQLPSGWAQTSPGASGGGVTQTSVTSSSNNGNQTPLEQANGVAVDGGNGYTWQDHDLSTPDVIDIYYDFRSIGAYSNQITSPEIVLAEKVLQQWSDALGGRLHFVRNTTAAAEDIINIGLGDLSALGYLSEARHTLGLGGATFTHNGDDRSIRAGVVWLDAAETWDLKVGNGDMLASYDFSTVLSQEIAHALGLAKIATAPEGALIDVADGTSQGLLFQSHCGCGGVPLNGVKYAGESVGPSDLDRQQMSTLYQASSMTDDLGHSSDTSGTANIESAKSVVAAQTVGTGVHIVTVDFNQTISNLDFGDRKLDSTAPASHVTSLPATENTTTFTVTWSGTDEAGGSGVAFYDIYVSDNGVAYTPLLSHTILTSTQFTGTVGHNYSFYSVATDIANNVEAKPATADATTTVATGLTVASMSVVTPTSKHGTVDSVKIIFSAAINSASLSIADLVLSRNGGGNLLTGKEKITGSGTTFTIQGLKKLTKTNGLYVMTVRASEVQSQSGVSGVGQLSRSFMTGPAVTVTNIKLNSTDTHSQPVESIDITFSTSISPSTFSIGDLMLTRNKGTNLLTGTQSISNVSGNTYRLSGLSGIASMNGRYSIVVNATGVTTSDDLNGSGSAKATWTLKQKLSSHPLVTTSSEDGTI